MESCTGLGLIDTTGDGQADFKERYILFLILEDFLIKLQTLMETLESMNMMGTGWLVGYMEIQEATIAIRILEVLHIG